MSGIGENGWGSASLLKSRDEEIGRLMAEIASLKAGAVSFGYGSVGEMALIIKSQRAENAELRRDAAAAKEEYDRTIATARDTVARFARRNAEMERAMAQMTQRIAARDVMTSQMSPVYQHDDEADRRQTQNEIGKLSVMGAAILALAVMLFAWKLGWIGQW